MFSVETERVLVRAPVASDRDRFVKLFTDPDFMVFTPGVLDPDGANRRFDEMLELVETVPYGKQPIIDKATDEIVGYTGAATVLFAGDERLEWGWRLAPYARGRGLATEATLALLTIADAHASGEMLCIVAPANAPSLEVASKVGFRHWRRWTWPDGQETELLVRAIGAGGAPLRPQ